MVSKCICNDVSATMVNLMSCICGALLETMVNPICHGTFIDDTALKLLLKASSTKQEEQILLNSLLNSKSQIPQNNNTATLSAYMLKISNTRKSTDN